MATGEDIIDLRSDTVTRPTDAMRRAMAEAEVGDDVLGDDPTVIRLQERVAELLGKEAACFVPSGSMANLTAIRAQTEPGDEIIAAKDSHFYLYETGGFAAVCGCSARFIETEDGRFSPEDIAPAMRAPQHHFPRSRLLVVENTHNKGGGTVWPLERVRSVAARGRELGLRVHLDGARVWNACAATGVSPAEFAEPFDTVSCCFSKGLGAPVGSAVAGDAATIARVHHFRKMLGGTMRQSGVLAAAALHALEHHRERLIRDHENAALLARGLAEVPGVRVRPSEPASNMVYFELDEGGPDAATLCAALREAGVLMMANGPHRVRAVCHLDVDTAQVQRVPGIVAAALGAAMSAGASAGTAGP